KFTFLREAAISTTRAFDADALERPRDQAGAARLAPRRPHSRRAPAPYHPLRAGRAFAPGRSGETARTPPAPAMRAPRRSRSTTHVDRSEVRAGPRSHLRYHLARRRAVPGRDHDP